MRLEPDLQDLPEGQRQVSFKAGSTTAIFVYISRRAFATQVQRIHLPCKGGPALQEKQILSIAEPCKMQFSLQSCEDFLTAVGGLQHKLGATNTTQNAQWGVHRRAGLPRGACQCLHAITLPAQPCRVFTFQGVPGRGIRHERSNAPDEERSQSMTLGCLAAFVMTGCPAALPAQQAV